MGTKASATQGSVPPAHPPSALWEACWVAVLCCPTHKGAGLCHCWGTSGGTPRLSSTWGRVLWKVRHGWEALGQTQPSTQILNQLLSYLLLSSLWEGT